MVNSETGQIQFLFPFDAENNKAIVKRISRVWCLFAIIAVLFSLLKWGQPTVCQSHCVPVPWFTSLVMVYQSRCASVLSCTRPSVSQSHHLPAHDVPVLSCTSPIVSQSYHVPVPSCPHPFMYQSYCVPVLSCTGPIVFQSYHVPVPLCHSPFMYQSHCVPALSCTSPIVS